MGLSKPSIARSDADSAAGSQLLQLARSELEHYHRRAEAARARSSDWRERLRVTTYALFRFLEEDERRRHRLLVELRSAGGHSAWLIGAEIDAYCDIIDEGRAQPTAPRSLTRATAEALGGAVFQELFLTAAGERPPAAEADRVPILLYTLVLPYVGETRAREELGIPPPPR